MAVTRPAWAAPPASPTRTNPVKLVLIIVIDQVRADLLTRFDKLFVEDGFRLLIDRGAYFSNCHYENAATKTGPGHSCVSTGANPAIHGIAGNHWVHEVNQQHESVFCSSDSTTKIVGQDGIEDLAGHSPRWLRAQTLADALKLATPAAHVVTCSLKESPPVVLGGLHPSGAYWWQESTGNFVTSTYYRNQLPAWVQAFNQERLVDSYRNQRWTRVLPKEQYDALCRRDDVPYERGLPGGNSNTFPHRLTQSRFMRSDQDYYRALYVSPFGNDLVLAFCRRALQELSIGQRGVTDMMAISLSSNDTIGHAYGPYSHEVMDVTLRTDRQLAALFKDLDQLLGLQHCLIALTADHGTDMVPEYALEHGISAGRIDYAQLKKNIEAGFQEHLGSARSGGMYVENIIPPWVYLGAEALGPALSSATISEILQTSAQRTPGVAAVFTAAEIRQPDFSASGDSALTTRIKNAYVPDRSGQLYVHIKPHWYSNGSASGHGTGYDYDTHVPLLWFGRGITPGRYDKPASPTDIAPTIAALLGIAGPADATGRVLQEMLKETPRGQAPR